VQGRDFTVGFVEIEAHAICRMYYEEGAETGGFSEPENLGKKLRRIRLVAYHDDEVIEFYCHIALLDTEWTEARIYFARR
jgi:hypothetical protein